MAVQPWRSVARKLTTLTHSCTLAKSPAGPNLLLFFHPKGRHALTESEWKASLGASVLLFVAIVGCVLFFCGLQAITLMAAIFYAMMVPHVHTAMQVDNRRHKPVFLLSCAVLLIAGTTGLVLVFQENIMGATILNYTFFGWIGYMFLGVFLRMEAN